MATPAPAPRARTWLFRLVLALGVPLAALGLLEGGLRVAGFGRSLDFFVPDERPGFYRTNPHFTERFFPASFALKPANFRLPRQKPAGTKRIFVIGESAAMGIPEPAFGLAPQLQAQLRAAQPGAKVEVYNLGVTAINSHALLPIVREALAFHPDLLVVYAGNNEVVGPYGTTPLPRGLIRLAGWVRGTRTGQLVQRLAAFAGRAGGYRDWRGMETFADKALPADDPRLARVYANFAANLEAMLAAATDENVPVLLSTVAVNVRESAPFVSSGELPAAWAEGAAAFAVGDWAAARSAASRAVAAAPAHAASHFLLAASADAAGDAATARPAYFEALRLDALRFRADARINDLIRRAASRWPGRVIPIDTAAMLGADPQATRPPPGHDYFFEHVHFTWEGNYAVALGLARTAADVLFGRTFAPRRLLEPEACAAAVGYTALGRLAMLQSMDKLTGRPPFTSQWRFAQDRTGLARQLAETGAALSAPGTIAAEAAKVARALAADPANPDLLYQAAIAALQAGEFATALQRLDRLAEVQPFSPEQAAARTLALRGLGRAAEAEPDLMRAIAEEPFYFQAYGLLAQLWVERGEADRARDFLNRALARMPDARVLRLTQAQVLARAGDWPGVEEQWRAILRTMPDDESALDPLVCRLAATGRTAEVSALAEAAFAYNPRSLANNRRLLDLASARGDLPATVKYLEAMADSGPVPPALYRELAVDLRQLGRAAEAQRAARRGFLAAQAAGETALLSEFEALQRAP